ncbi:hypothetical protein B0H14DRAFT_2924080 [Mycena olivaceomarginata]|nr:hypothetical protein B0H14DRAFT_2924080 [Mycena olivaceomarginata]
MKSVHYRKVFTSCFLGRYNDTEPFCSFQTSRANFGNLVWVTSVGLGSAAAADMLIGISLCYYLSQSRTGVRRTDNLISTLMKYSLTTGFLTGIIACLVVITFGVMPNNFVYVAFFWLLGKCYVNSVLAALNSRESLREKAHPNSGSFLNLSGITNSGVPPAMRKPSLSVNVEITSKTRTDYIYPPPPSASTTTSMVGPSTFSPLSPSMCSPLSPSTS